MSQDFELISKGTSQTCIMPFTIRDLANIKDTMIGMEPITWRMEDGVLYITYSTDTAQPQEQEGKANE